MKRLLFITILIITFSGCEKNEFDPYNPDVAKFVLLLKNGTYDFCEKGENGENLWLIMPEFSEDQIQLLIDFSKDTTHINIFPLNPVSSRTPFPADRDYFVLGECLLWTVEGIRNGCGYGSLDPFLVNSISVYGNKGLKSSEILIVRNLYQVWWSNFKNSAWKDKNPLDGSLYRWF